MTSTQRTGDLERAAGSPAELSGGTVVRSLTWLVLWASMAGNTVASSAGAPMPVRLGLGALTCTCAVTLIAQSTRSRP